MSIFDFFKRKKPEDKHSYRIVKTFDSGYMAQLITKDSIHSLPCSENGLQYYFVSTIEEAMTGIRNHKRSVERDRMKQAYKEEDNIVYEEK